MIFLHDFLPCFPVITVYQSQTIFMFSHHVSRHVLLHVLLYVSLHVFLYVSRHDFLSNLSIKQSSWFFVMTFYHDFSSWLFFITLLHDFSIMTFLSWLFFMTLYHIVFMFLVMTSIKKKMQKDNAKAKNGKISIFNSLDVKLEFLTSRVELTQFLVESSCIKLKIWATWLESSWKCEQLNFESSWIQNVNSKLNLTISLVSIWKSTNRKRSRFWKLR